MAGSRKSLSVSEAAACCRVGRTTVGYWIRSKKLHATRVGRNYTIPVEDLLFFLKSSGQKIPPELVDGNSSGPIFKSYQNCWHYWDGTDHGSRCHGCIALKNNLQACFTVQDSGLLGCSNCSDCQYYLDTFLHRIQFVNQIELPAAVFKDLYLWGGNSSCAEICSVHQNELVGMGIEKIVHPDSLPKVIETIRKLALGEPPANDGCVITIKNERQNPVYVRTSVYPLGEPANTFLVLGIPLTSSQK